jgi:polyisoprenyl-teichoic acid--peptidoglycan teichoic acid transferase
VSESGRGADAVSEPAPEPAPGFDAAPAGSDVPGEPAPEATFEPAAEVPELASEATFEPAGSDVPELGSETALALAELAALTDAAEPAPAPALGPARSAGLAAVLSFLWPGLGQLYRGLRRPALLFALPPLIAVALLLYGLRRGAVVLAAQLFADRTAALVAIAVVVLVGVWRLASVVHAYGAPGPASSGAAPSGSHRRTSDRIVAGVVVAVVVLSHLGVGAGLAYFSNEGQPVFHGNSDLVDLTTPAPTATPSSSSLIADASPTPTDSPTPAPSLDHRVTILFTGVDSSAGRSETLYDSIMVVSYSPVTNSVVLLSVPRDTAGFPLYSGGNVSVATRINSVPSYVKAGWIPSRDSPYMTLVKEVGYLVGLNIDYYAVMDFVGFRKMVDMVGGIDVVNSTVIDDATYNWLDGRAAGFHLGTGQQHLDGASALAYVRSRHGSSDWSRAARQQQVVVALLHKVAQADQLLNLPNLISTLASSITTNFPADQVGDYVYVGQNVPADKITSIVLKPPYSVFTQNNLSSASTTCLNMALVAGLSIQQFGTDSLWYHKSVPSSICGPLATPTPVASPTPGPTPDTTAAPTVEIAPTPTAASAAP